jgi:predicted homoserine dehydrogenase-like protein
MPARDSLAIGGLPIGLAHNIRVTRPVAAGASLTWADVEIDRDDDAYAFRKEMEKAFA